MRNLTKTKNRTEFGDFQTPSDLALRVCNLLAKHTPPPASIIEPTCGKGSFLLASEAVFRNCDVILGYEINPKHVRVARSAVKKSKVEQGNFFTNEWSATLRDLSEPILIVGNPPWVTNSAVGAISGKNLPAKSNLQGLSGIDAITGKSNFDISEWMLLHLLERLSGRTAILAMLCKTVVARKVLHHAWNGSFQIRKSSIYTIDAQDHFGAAVDACLLVCHLEPNSTSRECDVYTRLDATEPTSAFALRGDLLVADLAAYDTYGHYCGASHLKWRSGIKHDCSRIMELRPAREADVYTNGLGESVKLEPDFLYPMLKSSELAKGAAPSRCMLVTQKTVGSDTTEISGTAPLTWRYLESHGETLAARSSSIYRNRPRFSIFGVGEYSFAQWKVAISGFYKNLVFRCVPPVDGKPVVLDDTCYFLPCDSEDEARELADLLNAEESRGFFESFVFWDAKRPITATLLSKLDINKVAADSVSWPSYPQPQGQHRPTSDTPIPEYAAASPDRGR